MSRKNSVWAWKLSNYFGKMAKTYSDESFPVRTTLRKVAKILNLVWAWKPNYFTPKTKKCRKVTRFECEISPVSRRTIWQVQRRKSPKIVRKLGRKLALFVWFISWNDFGRRSQDKMQIQLRMSWEIRENCCLRVKIMKISWKWLWKFSDISRWKFLRKCFWFDEKIKGNQNSK